jgi:hypothetical protein
MECSAKERNNVDAIFRLAAETALTSKAGGGGCCVLL